MVKQNKLNDKEISVIREALAKHEASTKRLMKSTTSEEIIKVYENQLVDIARLQLKLTQGELAL